jgi:hypothetical protein
MRTDGRATSAPEGPVAAPVTKKARGVVPGTRIERQT